MAYQNVGQCRFYISWGDWWKSLGANVARNHTISPIETYSDTISNGDEWETWQGDNYDGMSFIPANGSKGANFLAVLNHNLVDGTYYFINKRNVAATDTLPAAADYGAELSNNGQIEVANYPPTYAGFSIHTHNGTNKDWSSYETESITSGFRTTSAQADATEFTGTFGCYVWGKYYDMSHSPDLKLTMTREMDGVKRIRTKGGADLVNHKYIKPAMWGSAGAWELHPGTSNQALSRSGRRVWDLSFSYLQDSDVFPDVSSLTNYETSGYSAGDDVTLNTLLDGDDFYANVIHKTNGGQLPFIFQPDKDNNNPDQFAICKLDMKSFKFEQVSNGVYSVKLKIREIW